MRRRFLLTVGAVDVAMLGIASVVGAWAVFGDPRPWTAARPVGNLMPLVAYLAVGGVIALGFSLGIWSGSVPRPSYGRALLVVGGGFTAAAVGTLILRTYWSRSFLGWVLVVWLLGSIAYRFWARRRPWSEDLAVVTREEHLVADLKEAPHVGSIRVVDPAFDGNLPPPMPGEVLAVDFRSPMSERVARYVAAASVSGRGVASLSDVYEAHTGRVALVHLAEGWEVSEPLRRVEAWLWAKRSVDVVATLAFAAIWLPVLLLGCLAVKVSSPGPVFFRQVRIGFGGQPFTLLKLRTMSVDAEEAGPAFAEADDPRIFPVGRLLRRTRIDELPQLVNVLQGKLSLVGPRPEQAAFVERFKALIPFYDQRHLVRPGITGWAQVNQGYANGVEEAIEKLTFDLYYLKHMSPWLDVSILARSVGTVLTGAGR